MIGPFILTLKLASISTLILFVISLPVAYLLAFSSFRLKPVVEAMVSLPLILPPSVLGFYLLLAFSPERSFGGFLDEYFDIRLVFTFTGLVISSVIYSLPFMVQPFQSGFRMIPRALIEASYTLGKGRFETLIHVLLPNMRAALITGTILAFAHTIGEFGVVLMIGGSIPEETHVVSIALYDEVQAMHYHTANIYAGILLAFSFVILVTVYSINQRFTNNLFRP
ncbi:molybdate ABC transporter permease subunit [Chryseolinea sp. T2]|uniref:molybdate ABC transporter permease subunit n=1 Tax=Chryseolinea sp. T2 TaxID=3129255 RepID=UPI003077D96F